MQVFLWLRKCPLFGHEYRTWLQKRLPAVWLHWQWLSICESLHHSLASSYWTQVIIVDMHTCAINTCTISFGINFTKRGSFSHTHMHGRPMYVASTDDNWPDGHLPVAELLQESLEPLFIVSLVYGTCVAWCMIHVKIYKQTHRHTDTHTI